MVRVGLQWSSFSISVEGKAPRTLRPFWGCILKAHFHVMILTLNSCHMHYLTGQALQLLIPFRWARTLEARTLAQDPPDIFIG